jgi:HD-like signal output (HDOD) protein
MSTQVDNPFIIDAPHDAGTWVALFHRLDTPVLTSTALALDELRANEDSVDAHLLAETLADDPLMTLKLLRHVTARRSARALTDAETVTAAIVLLGITPFFHAFQELPTIEQRLADYPEALEGIQAVLRRAYRAARFALGFAVHRMDHDAAVIHEAALLHDFAEMLLWAHAPTLALEVQSRMRAEPTLRSVAVQRAVLHVDLSDLQQRLMHQWRLPELLVRISDDHASPSPQVRNVQLAIRVARHSALGWDNPALPDDMDELSGLLNLSPPHVQQLLLELDA